MGEVTTGTVQSTLGFQLVNQTGAAIPHVAFGYTGEQWRVGATGGFLDKLDVQYSVNATALNNGSWQDVDALDFVTPNNTSSAGAINGNAGQNRQLFPTVFVDVTVPPNGLFWVRWVPQNIPDSNDGLAIDEFSIYTIQDDADGDGRPDGADNCPTTSNSDQADLDGDGQGNPCDDDDDGDGVFDPNDNCPAANADQADTDADGQGDLCDVDDDADGLLDGSDNCPTQTGPPENHGCPGQPDGDGDGVPDATDNCPSQVGPVDNRGCPVASQPDDSACDDAKAALAKAKAKVKKAKAKVKAACNT